MRAHAEAGGPAVETGYATNGDVTIRHAVSGPADGEPLLLLTGVGMQLVMWHDDLVTMLIEQGFRVARLDHRDCGESTHLSGAGRPSIVRMLTRPSGAPYSMRDMAADAVAVLDALGWASAHVAGMSMGGMIAQEMAIRHPERVRTLASMMATPAPSIGRISFRTGVRLNRLQDRPVGSRDDAGRLMVDLFDLIGSPELDMEPRWLHEAGARAYDRGYDQAGRLRQEYALMTGGDRRPELARLRVPTLVVHGDADRIWRPVAGRATAQAVPGARLVMVPRLGHGLFPRSTWPGLVAELGALAGR
jgi:pimeloyl-ACP methyl ester carboxylesterase